MMDKKDLFKEIVRIARHQTKILDMKHLKKERKHEINSLACDMIIKICSNIQEMKGGSS